MKTKKFYLFLIAISCFALTCSAEVKPNSLFSDHMVLQREVAVPVWGTAAEGEKVTVSFNGQIKTTNAVNGRWMVKLDKLKAGGPYTMTISGTNTVSVADILVGEVWLCSGQSNMERQLGPRPPQKPIVDWEKERDAANYPQIREYYVPLKYSSTLIEDVGNRWTICSPDSVKNFSAVGYFFARDLYNKIHVPIGILFSAYGGTPAEHWTSKEALVNDPELKELVENYQRAINGYPMALEKFKGNEPMLMNKFRLDSASAVEEKKPLPKKPAAPQNPTKGKFLNGLYNAMINPLLPYAMKGVCWYQGENNNGNPKQYIPILKAMVNGWRKDWLLGDFPFLIVQIAPHKDMLPELREAQLIVTQQIPNTALIVLTDCGDSADIHPSYKQPVGERLALAARALAYHEKIEYSGPLYESVKIENGKAILNFSHAGKGLVAKTGELSGFTIAGADNNFYPAKAEIKGQKIIVYSEDVKDPVSVRYGWANVPHVNLYNKEGLPASPFRTNN